jgi:hypothetical protein
VYKKDFELFGYEIDMRKRVAPKDEDACIDSDEVLATTPAGSVRVQADESSAGLSTECKRSFTDAPENEFETDNQSSIKKIRYTAPK